MMVLAIHSRGSSILPTIASSVLMIPVSLWMERILVLSSHRNGMILVTSSVSVPEVIFSIVKALLVPTPSILLEEFVVLNIP